MVWELCGLTAQCQGPAPALLVEKQLSHCGSYGMPPQRKVFCAVRPRHIGYAVLTSLGAMRELKVMRFSGGMLPALDRPCTTTVSPLTTCRYGATSIHWRFRCSFQANQ